MSQPERQLLPPQFIPSWVKGVVFLAALLLGAGAIIAFLHPAMLVDPQADITPAVRTYAGYLTARNLVLALMLLVLMQAAATRALGNLLAIVGLIQVMDCAVDCIQARWTVAPGVLILAGLFLSAATRLCGPLWRKGAWM